MESIHDGIIHICEYCDHKATIKGSLCQHMQSIHNDVKHSSDYKAIDKSNLCQHVVSIHNGVIHSYEYCDHKATTKVAFVIVQSIHDRLKHKCEYCDYKATDIEHLQGKIINIRAHISTKQQITLFWSAYKVGWLLMLRRSFQN